MAVLAIDLGASSGRGIVFELKDGRLFGTEVHRFLNEPVYLCQRFKWDILRIFHEVKKCILNAVQKGFSIESVAIDTWGVDYGLIDSNGDLARNPYHYRDSRTAGIVKSFPLATDKDLYNFTGIANEEFNTVYQLYKEGKETDFKNIDTLLFTPNLLSYFLCGVKATEPTIASTSAMYNHGKGFNDEILTMLNIPKEIMPNILPTGTVLGYILPEIMKELNIDGQIKVILGCGHDTACAVLCVPNSDVDSLFISSGTWSLFGTELSQPIINELAFKNRFTNEIGFECVRFLKNIMGMWVFEEYIRDLKNMGIEYEYKEFDQMAEKAAPFKAFIDMADKIFNAPFNMSQKIKDYVKKTQNIDLNDVGEITRCIYESLALEYKFALDGIEKITGIKYKTLNILGGGGKNKLLCQFSADLLGINVVTGITEATAQGNALTQFYALGQLKDKIDIKTVINNDPNIIKYSPNCKKEWNESYQKYLILKKYC